MRALFILPTVYVLLLITSPTSTDESDAAALSIYYDPDTKLPLEMESILAIKVSKMRRVAFRSNGCSCQSLVCGCCTGINIQQFNFQREGCLNFTYDPLDFSITMNMLMNENVFFSNRISAKNPPPLCVPIPMPYLPSVNFCARLYDVYTPGQNLHMCLNFETRIEQATVLVLKFDCMKMGSDGFAVMKPGAIDSQSTTTEAQVDLDVYDEVTEIKYKRDPLYVNNN